MLGVPTVDGNRNKVEHKDLKNFVIQITILKIIVICTIWNYPNINLVQFLFSVVALRRQVVVLMFNELNYTPESYGQTAQFYCPVKLCCHPTVLDQPTSLPHPLSVACIPSPLCRLYKEKVLLNTFNISLNDIDYFVITLSYIFDQDRTYSEEDRGVHS